ncbi:zinc-binding dehydrogenase [Gordonia sp. DT30]|uniref:zinc-binding dehydrogenase n=1 Tax=Gordonia sp. DT30 TaxID=3416546 RepID=UPI003CE6AA8A
MTGVFGARLTAPGPDPARAVALGSAPVADAPTDWATVRMRAATLNASDLATMAGHGFDAAGLPTILGSDGAGIDADGNDVIIYPILTDPKRLVEDPMLDPGLQMLSQGIDGTFAETVRVPAANLVPKPAGLSWEAAACLGTAWLTAYRAVFTRAQLRPGETVVVYGAGGGVATAATVLARAGGARVWVVARSPARGARAVDELDADAAYTLDESLPGEVDAVIDCVGGATVAHAIRWLRPGGRLILVGAAAGAAPVIDMPRVFTRSLSILGSAMGSPAELVRLAALCVRPDVRVPIDSVFRLVDIHAAFERARSGQAFGKVVLDCR